MTLQKSLTLLVLISVISGTVYGITVPETDDYDLIREAQIHQTDILVSPIADYLSFRDGVTWDTPAWAAFLTRFGDQWDIAVDIRGNRPDIIQGQGIPWVPGDGNTLTWSDIKELGTEPGKPIDLEVYASLALAFIDENRDLFRVDLNQLQLDDSGSMVTDRYSSIRFIQEVDGIRVWKSHVYFRVNNGNLIQFGTHLYENVVLETRPSISEQEAFNIAANYLVSRFSGPVSIIEPPELLIVPAASEGESFRPGEPYVGERGTGYTHYLTYKMVLKAEGSEALWETLVDAQSGDILVLQDERKFGTVKGGIYPVTNLDLEVVRPFSHARVSNNGTVQTDAGGNYTYTGGTASCSLNGIYANISDNCGSINLSTSVNPGDLNFGSGTGDDCDTPGFGGSGNTHSSRSCFYHITRYKEKVMEYQPSISWLTQNLTANVNINNTCNAYWGGSSVNFYRSGGGCSNTGEIASVFLHETAHGLDSNDQNGFSADNGSGEAYADISSFLMTHVSCIGHNFRPGTPCNFGCDSTCTGVRDVDTDANVTPGNIASSPADCDRWSCPYWGYMGPMGYEGHCESLIASQAWWDAIKAVRSMFGDQAGWLWADRLWYTAVANVDSAYQVVSGGQCNPSATVNGCNGDSYYTVLLGIDDDDGNLANGTPFGCYLWQAFNSHGIACGSQPACYSACPSIGAPSITGSSTGGTVTINWSSVSNAVQYEVFRNDIGCGFGWIPMGTTASLDWVDAEVAEGVTYYYIVQGIGSDSDCRGDISNCASVYVSAGPTPTPGPPTSTPTITPTPTPSPCIWAGFNVNETPNDENRFDDTTYFYNDGSGTGTVNADGTLTGWMVRATQSGTIGLRIIRPSGGNTYTYIGGSSMVYVSSGINNFEDSIAIPVQQGDIAAIYFSASDNAQVGLNGSGDYLYYYEGDVADVSSFSPGGNSSRNGYQLVRIYGDCAGTPTPTPSFTAVYTNTPIPTFTHTPPPTTTQQPTATPPPPPTSTSPPQITATPTRTPVPTSTSAPNPTNTPLSTNTPIPTFTPQGTNTPIPTFTPPPTNTAIPTFTPEPTGPPPTATQLPTYTPQPTYTPMPTFTPVPTETPEATSTAEPTHTPVPECETTGVTIWMPSHMYEAGDTCACRVMVCNAAGQSLTGYPLFVVLEVYGMYFYGPSFGTTIDSYVTLYPEFEPGMQVVTVIPEFSWPSNVGTANGLMFHAALLTPDMNALMGQMDSWEFGWN